jgi:hypothetical protein
MDEFSYEIGRLSGILEAMSAINGKTNHGFTFEIVALESDESIETKTENFLKESYPDALIMFDNLQSWREDLSKIIEKWLFHYQPHKDINGNTIQGGYGSGAAYLQDVYESFSMSSESFRADFLAEIIDSIEVLLNVRRALSVSLNTKSWYECDWDDVVLEGSKGNIFIHLGVSD